MVLNNSQYDSIMRDYHARQINAKNELDRRTAEVLFAIPQYKTLQDQISSLSVKSAISSIKDNGSSDSALVSKIHNIEQQMAQLLKAAGFPSNYLQLQFNCPICQDTGYVDNHKCACFKQAEINLLYNQSNIKNYLSTENFDTFSYDYYSKNYKDSTTGLTPFENIQKIVNICKSFIKDFPTGDSLVFYGDTGVGKTFLTHCIAKEILDKSNSVLYLSAIDFFEAFSHHDRFVDNYNLDFFPQETQIINCDLLIIDDLGTELSNTYTNSKLFLCINSRLMANKSTIISTNLTPKDFMNTYSERIFSRISSSYSLLKMYGDDIRILKKS